jgi:hypothetical protein
VKQQIPQNFWQELLSNWGAGLTILGFFLTWGSATILWIYANGRRRGRNEQRNSQFEKAFTKFTLDIKEELNKNVVDIHNRIRKIENSLNDSDGNPKYLLSSDHRIICGEHKKFSESEFRHIAESFKEVKETIDKLSDSVLALATSYPMRTRGGDKKDDTQSP